MAEIAEITLNINVEGKVLEDLTRKVDNLASSIRSAGNTIGSTFSVISTQLESIAGKLRDTGDEISLFGMSFNILDDKTGTLVELERAIKRFKETLVFTNKDFIKGLTAFFELLTEIIESNPRLTKFLTTMAAIGVVVLPLVGIFGGLAGAAGALGAVLGIAGLKVAAIGVAIGLVIAEAVLLIQNWDLIKETARDVWDYVTRTVSNAAHSILSFVLPIAGGFIGMWEGVKENAASAWGSIVETVTQQLLLLPNAVGIIMGGISESFNLAAQTIQTIWNNGIQYIKDNTGLDEFVLNLAESILRIFNGMVEGLKQLWRNFLNYLDENFPQVSGAAGFVKDRLGDAGDYVRETVDDVEHAAIGTAGFITGLFKQHTGELGNFLSENYSRVTTFASNQIEAAGNFVREQTGTVGNFVKEQATNAGKALKDELSADNFVAGIIAPLNPFASIGIRAAKPLGVLSSLRDRFIEIRNAMDQTGNQSGKTGDEVGLLESILNSLRGETNLVGKSLNNGSQSFDEYKEGVNQAGEATKKWTEEELVALIQKVNELRGVLGRIEFKNILGVNVPFLKIDDKTTEDIAEVQETFEETSNAAQKSLDELGVFAADIAAEINDTFADLIFRSLKGDFDDMKDFWKSALDAMLETFSQFIATVISNPIRIGLQAFLSGTSVQPAGGAGGQGAVQTAQAGLGLFGSGLGESFRSLGSLVLGEFSGMTGLLGTVQAALPAIGTILAAAAIAIPIISGLLKKTPRLDIDFDEVKNDVEERAAVVAEFLDPDFYMENIGRVSVKRGGVGIGAGGSNQILELIRERIEETIEGIQDIIAKLPTDMFRELNETLLGAEIDIDTVIAGERLLEFDAKGKKIAEKFQAFIEGELPAKFFASIRESFFDPAFQALGVSAEGTQALIDDFMAKMEAAGSREARAEVGAEFIATFGAFVDAFNIVSGNVNDSIGQTIQTEEWEYRLAA